MHFSWFYKVNKLFKHYKYDVYNPHSISSNYVSNIIEDQEGNLWIGTWEGLNCFNPTSGKFYRYKHDEQNTNSLINNKIQHVFIDSYNNIWIATPDGLDLLDKTREHFTHFNADPDDSYSLIDNFVSLTYQDKEENLWVGTSTGLNLVVKDNLEKGQIEFKNYSQSLTDPNSMSGFSVSSIFNDSNGNLWIGTEEGLNLFNKEGQEDKCGNTCKDCEAFLDGECDGCGNF